jgi:regulator of replication initiation timing
MDTEIQGQEGQQKEDKKEFTEVEHRAMEMGWRPLEEFDGDEASFIDAKEFVNRKPLFDKIEHQSKQIKAVTKALEALKTHYTTVEVASYNRALSNLKAERKQALTDGDGDKFEEIDTQIKTVEAQAADIKRIQDTPAVESGDTHPEFQAWSNRNPWYNTTTYMRAYADEVGTKFAQQGMAPGEVLKEVEKAVRQEFPQKFRNPNKDTAPDVSSSQGAPRRGREESTGGLNEQELRIMNTLVRGGHITKEKYLADLKLAKQQA